HTFSKNFILDPNIQSFLSKKDQVIAKESLWVLMIRIHIALALIALLTGPIGILARIRQRWPALHRWNGRIYALSIVINFIPSLYVSFFASGGAWSTIGFIILNTLWLLSTIVGVRSARKRNIQMHSKWMTRSFFLSFANTTIYILVAILHYAMDQPYGFSYTVAVWACWILNLSLAEAVIRRKSLAG
ncbi:DUF2306 domain-containing protein, partial [Paenibacillus sp. GCM10012303]|uniref:DUF2306 domain-containing protein n=1 Tax=Paenibacillus sp. GCM10012303 TaxID=3317340 RepID=UPI0036179B02